MSDRKQYFRELRKWYLDAGICFNCKTRPVVEGETRCDVFYGRREKEHTISRLKKIEKMKSEVMKYV